MGFVVIVHVKPTTYTHSVYVLMDCHLLVSKKKETKEGCGYKIPRVVIFREYSLTHCISAHDNLIPLDCRGSLYMLFKPTIWRKKWDKEDMGWLLFLDIDSVSPFLPHESHYSIPESTGHSQIGHT